MKRHKVNCEVGGVHDLLGRALVLKKM
jgi:hypothetical protein